MNKEEQEKIEKRNKRLKIKLAIYFGFLGFVILLVLITGSTKPSSMNNQNNKNTKSNVVEYYDMQKEIYEGNYNYVFEVSNGIKYTGVSTKGVRTGYMENNGNIIKYKKDTYTYKIEGTNEIKYDELYTGLDSSLFDFKKLFDKINSSSTIKARNGENYTYSYDNIVIKTNDKHIVEIKVNSNVNYTFTFTF